MNLSIRMKLVMGFGSAILMLILLLGVVQVKTQEAGASTDRVLYEATPAVDLCLSIQGEIHHALSMHRGYMILGLPALAQERLETWDVIDGYLLELDELASKWESASLKDEYANFKLVMADFKTAQQKIADVSWTENDLPANVQYFDVAEPFGDAMVESLQAILDEEESLEASAERKLLVRRVSEAEGHLLKSRNAIASYLGSGSEEHLAKINSCLTACQASVDRLMTMTGLFTAEQKKHYDEYIESRTVFIEKAKEAVQIRSNPGYCVSEDICLNTVTPLANEAAELVGVLGEKQAAFKAASMKEYNDASKSMVATVKVVGVVSIVVSSMLAFFLSTSITRRIGTLMKYSQSIADRDLSVEDLDFKSKDEIGQLACAVNVMKNSIKEVIADVSHTTQAVASASTELAASAEEMSAGMDTQQQQTQQVAAAVEELSQSVAEVAAKSSDASTASGESQRLAEDGGEIVSNTVSEMEGIAREVQSSADTINTLGQKSQTIGEIIAVINDIADQTNLLALNAAIEAARAGDQGRGFAVVADEVRKLADRSSTAASEISQAIQELRNNSSDAAERMRRTVEQAMENGKLASGAAENLDQIVIGVRQVSQDISDITESIREVNSAAELSSEACDGLAKTANSLAESTGRFIV